MSSDFNALGRRTALAGIAAAGVAASGPAQAQTAHRHLDLEDPQDNLDGYLKSRGDISGEVSVAWATGKVWSLISGRRSKLLLQSEAVNLTRSIKDDTGYTFLQRESMWWRDAETGEIIDTWYNPYIERTVETFHIQNASVSRHYDVHGPDGPFHFDYIEQGEDLCFYQDLMWFGESPLKMEEYPAYVGSDYYQGGGIYNSWVKRADIDNPDITKAPNVTTHTSVRQWLPWMEMGAWEGGLVISNHGKKIMGGVEDLPPKILAYVEKNAPDYLQPPDMSMKDEVRTFYGEFKKYVEAKRAG